MEKVSITIAFKDGKPEILKFGDPVSCLEAYQASINDTQYDFVGYLRKPAWHKRTNPKTNVRLEDQRHERQHLLEAEKKKTSADILEAQAKAATAAAEAALEAAKELRAAEEADRKTAEKLPSGAKKVAKKEVKAPAADEAPSGAEARKAARKQAKADD